jgi:hypothetical protein
LKILLFQIDQGNGFLFGLGVSQIPAVQALVFNINNLRIQDGTHYQSVITMLTTILRSANPSQVSKLKKQTPPKRGFLMQTQYHQKYKIKSKGSIWNRQT